MLAVAVALSFGTAGLVLAPHVAHAQARGSDAVATCRTIEEEQGAEYLEDIYGSFGGCVVNFTDIANGAADTAHGCEFLVELGVFSNRGACIRSFERVS